MNDVCQRNKNYWTILLQTILGANRRESLDRHIDGIVLLVKNIYSFLCALGRLLSTCKRQNITLQAYEFTNEHYCHNLGQESEVSKQLTARNWYSFSAVLYQARNYRMDCSIKSAIQYCLLPQCSCTQTQCASKIEQNVSSFSPYFPLCWLFERQKRAFSSSNNSYKQYTFACVRKIPS